MTPLSAVILDRELKEDIKMAFNRELLLKELDPNGHRYVNTKSELNALYREIGWQLVLNIGRGLR